MSPDGDGSSTRTRRWPAAWTESWTTSYVVAVVGMRCTTPDSATWGFGNGLDTEMHGITETMSPETP